MYDKSGTENLRAGATVKGPAAAPAPSTEGDDVGGRSNLRANATVMVGPRGTTATGTSDIPATTFRDKAV